VIGDGHALDDSKIVSRSFEFHYGATIKDLPENETVRVWFPIPQSSPQQTVNVREMLVPGNLQIAFDETYHNKIGFFEVAKRSISEIKFQIDYDVLRNEAKTGATPQALPPDQRALFLRANQLVPVEGRPLQLLEEKRMPNNGLEAGHLIYDIVNSNMRYDKSVPGYGQGDVLRACDAHAGNCTDFHSLFISLARSQQIPARFEIGFLLPPVSENQKSGKIAGYHCWAWFHTPENGWVPVDISEASKNPSLREYCFGNLTADRIAFSTGRDIKLSPQSKSEPLNFFIYPHVEVNGQPWPPEKVALDFSFTSR
jgi:transglutaminase-like putative cysteine protease